MQTKKVNFGPPKNLWLGSVEENSGAVRLHMWIRSGPRAIYLQEANFSAVTRGIQGKYNQNNQATNLCLIHRSGLANSCNISVRRIWQKTSEQT